MNRNTTWDHGKIEWALTTFEFLVERLEEDVSSHPHKNELIQLMRDQYLDDM